MSRSAPAGLLVIAALLAGAFGFWFNTQRLEPQPSATEALWRAEFKDLQGRPFKMDSLKGQILVVNFWATWCGPCVEEMPDFQRASQSDVGKKAVFVGIGIDYAKNMRPFADKLGISYLLLESGSQGLDLLKAVGNRSGALPYTLVLKPSGEVAAAKLGKFEYPDLLNMLSGL